MQYNTAECWDRIASQIFVIFCAVSNPSFTPRPFRAITSSVIVKLYPNLLCCFGIWCLYYQGRQLYCSASSLSQNLSFCMPCCQGPSLLQPAIQTDLHVYKNSYVTLTIHFHWLTEINVCITITNWTQTFRITDDYNEYTITDKCSDHHHY